MLLSYKAIHIVCNHNYFPMLALLAPKWYQYVCFCALRPSVFFSESQLTKTPSGALGLLFHPIVTVYASAHTSLYLNCAELLLTPPHLTAKL